MPDEELTLSQASNLLNYHKPHVAMTSDRWPNPHRAALREAIEAGESFIVMDGTRFKISDVGDKFYLRPVNGFVPCGWLARSWLYEESS